MGGRFARCFFLVSLFLAASARALEPAAATPAPPSDAAAPIQAASTAPATVPSNEKKYPRFELGFENRGYGYNSENGSWDETRQTLTYMEDVFQPYLKMTAKEGLTFSFGIGMLVPFNQEDRILRYWPYVQSRYEDDEVTVEVGSLNPDHNFPAPLRDPLRSLLPRIRLNCPCQIPIPYETFPEGLDAHGSYEYGYSVRWKKHFFGHGENYFNWQLRDMPYHRERFDVGLIQTFDVIKDVPLYMGLHYWHNGGHENPHPVEVTENYTAALGLRNETYTVVYVASLWVPDRSKANLNVFGQAFYAEYNFQLGARWVLTPVIFVSDQYFNVKNHQFISVEGDPFFRIPLYVGLNIFKTWNLWTGADLKLGFVNGAYVPYRGGPWQSRYDQTIQFIFRHAINL